MGFWLSRRQAEPRTDRNSASLEVGRWLSQGDKLGIWPTYLNVASGAFIDHLEMLQKRATNKRVDRLSTSPQIDGGKFAVYRKAERRDMYLR